MMKKTEPSLDRRLNGHQPVQKSGILITGGAGFIGTNLAAMYARQGDRVRIFDNLSRPGVEQNADWLAKEFGDQIQFTVADVRDAMAVEEAIAGVRQVFHFAAQVAVTTSLEDPQHDFEVNARGTLNVLEACRKQAVPPALLFTSTNKVYGGLEDVQLIKRQNQYQPANASRYGQGIDESRPLDFHSPYGCSKGTADQYVLDYARCYGIPTVVFRMSCIYGPHQCGTEDQGWVAHFARAVLEEQPITVYGDGCQVRDLLFVEDLTAAMQAAMQQISLTRGQAFNMGGGVDNAMSVRQVIESLAQIHGSISEVTYGPWRQGDQRYYVSDTSLFRRTTGWTPQVNCRAGIDRLYDWLSHSAALNPSLVRQNQPLPH